jgi:hypothetical protein
VAPGKAITLRGTTNSGMLVENIAKVETSGEISPLQALIIQGTGLSTQPKNDLRRLIRVLSEVNTLSISSST